MKKIIIIIILLCQALTLHASNYTEEASSLYHYIMGMVFLHDGRVEATIGELEKALYFDGDSLHLHKIMLELYYSSMDYEKAELEANKIIELQADDITANKYLAEITSVQRGDIKKAIEFQKRVIELTPGDVNAKFFLAALFGRLDDVASAEKEYRKILKLDSKNSQAFIMLASIAEYGKDYARALKFYKKALKLDSYNPDIYDGIGIIYFNMKAPQKAEKFFLHSVNIRPAGIRALYHLVLINEGARRWDRVIKYLKSIHKMQPEVPETYIHLGISYLELDKYDDAIIIIKKLLARDPARGAAWTVLGMAHEYKKNFGEAAEAFSKAIEFNPENKENYFHLGLCYDNLKRFEKSEEAFKKAIQLDPGFAQARNYLGYSWADRGINLNKALVHVEAAMKIEPDNGAYVDSLGWIYYKRGEYNRAEKFLRKASRMVEDPVIYEHLGDTYREMGLMKKARDFYKKAENLNPGSSAIQEKINKLKAD